MPKGGYWYLHQRREGGSEKVARFEVGRARRWKSLVPVGDENSRDGKEVLAGEHVDQM